MRVIDGNGTYRRRRSWRRDAAALVVLGLGAVWEGKWSAGGGRGVRLKDLPGDLGVRARA